MSRFMRGDSVQIMAGFPDNSIDFILTDPPYLVGFKDRSGRSIANDVSDEWVPDAQPADLINLQRRALIGLHSEIKAVRKESRRVWNWLARHAREVEAEWGTSRAPEFAAAFARLPPLKRKLMQQRLEGCVLILPADVFSDITLLLPMGRTAESAVHTPAWNTYTRSDLYAKPPHPLD